MRKRFGVVLGVLIIGALGLAVWALRQDQGPVYEGKTLYSWILLHAQSSNPRARDNAARNAAQQAIHQMGSNAFPTLLDWVTRTPSPMTRQTLTWIEAVTERFLMPTKVGSRAVEWFVTNQYPQIFYKDYSAAAAYGFRVFGPKAQPAVPDLAALLRHKDPLVRSQAAHCLARIGPAAKNAVPALVECLDDPAVQDNALGALSRIELEPGVLVPVLAGQLSSPRMEQRLWSVGCLGSLGVQAQDAVPKLTELLTDPHPEVRRAATNALKRISPDAATTVNVRQTQP